MKPDRPRPLLRAALLSAALLACGAPAADPPPTAPAKAVKSCEDPLRATAEIDPKLDSKFFHTLKTSRPWHVVEHEDGHLESTLGSIQKEDLLFTEHTARCTSSHQGDHEMEFCDAVAGKDGLSLFIYGGAPAFGSSLEVLIRPDQSFQCTFDAIFVAPTPPYRWKITGKSLKLKQYPLRPGQRCYAWISVEFEQLDPATGKSESFKIEGELKPVVQSPAE